MQLPEANRIELAAHFDELRLHMIGAKTTLMTAHDALMGVLRASGQTTLSSGPLPKDIDSATEWTGEMEQLYQNLLAGADFATTALEGASKGSRAVFWPENDFNWGLEALPGDPFRIAVSPDGIPMLLTSSGAQFNAPATSTLGNPVVPTGILIVAGIAVVAKVAMAYFGYQAILAAASAVENLINRLFEWARHHQMYECIKSQDPADCQKAIQTSDAGHVATLEKEIAKLKQQQEAADAPIRALWAVAGIGAVAVLGYGVYEYSKKPYSK